MTDIGAVKYERAVKNESGGYTYCDITAKVDAAYEIIRQVSFSDADALPLKVRQAYREYRLTPGAIR